MLPTKNTPRCCSYRDSAFAMTASDPRYLSLCKLHVIVPIFIHYHMLFSNGLWTAALVKEKLIDTWTTPLA